MRIIKEGKKKVTAEGRFVNRYKDNNTSEGDVLKGRGGKQHFELRRERRLGGEKGGKQLYEKKRENFIGRTF